MMAHTYCPFLMSGPVLSPESVLESGSIECPIQGHWCTDSELGLKPRNML